MTLPADPAPLVVGLLGHSPNSDNLGVGALTVAQVAIVEKVAAAMGRPVRFVLVGTRDSRPPYVTGDRIAIVDPRLRQIARRDGLYGIARGCDVVLDIGAGDSWADIYGLRRFGLQLAAKLAVLAAGTPLILSPQTIGPFDRTWTRRVATAVMNRTRAVFTRDALSSAYLASIGFAGTAHEATDVALRLPYDRATLPRDGRILAGINVSGLLFNGGYSGRNMFGLAGDYAETMRMLIGRLAARPDVEVHLVAHVISETQPVEDDWRVAQQLAEAFPGVRLAPRFAAPSEAKSYIAGLDFFTGSRMHACIAAFSSGVPVVPLAYSRKFAGLFGTLGYDATVDCRTEAGDALVGRVLAGLDDRAALAARLAECLAEGERRLAVYESVLRDTLAAVGARRAR